MSSSPWASEIQMSVQINESIFQKSDESAFSIIPSHMSSRFSVSTKESEDLPDSNSIEDMVYRRLSFEDLLFTARVYKRNYRNAMMFQQASPRAKLLQSSRKAAEPLKDPSEQDDIMSDNVMTLSPAGVQSERQVEQSLEDPCEQDDARSDIVTVLSPAELHSECVAIKPLEVPDEQDDTR